ncbi:GNAT family N-acetyltransferase [Thioalkalivibrio sp. ALE16]|uniref:GNAT family N-acetyltransferase n=1 Tax=Thioalkalivibrio sp. ALE16 TaxID=1158172 RepID=UPI00036BBCA4|nr:GNAT family N-acetyltransferase [Thioalkalivibrio sp. ALE16]
MQTRAATQRGDDARATGWQLREASPDEAFAPPAPGTMMEHDPEWLLAIRHPGHGRVLLAEQDSRQLPIYVHDGALSFVLGGMALRRIEIRRHVLTGNLPDWSRDDLTAILSALRGQLDSRGVVFLIGVVEGEPLWQALHSVELRRDYHVLQSGHTDVRRGIDLPPCFDDYLGSLPRDHRKDLKRRERRFDREFGPRAEVRVMTQADELKSFLEQVAPVSRRTYQHRILKLGVGPGGAIERQLLAASDKGRARCYGLYVDNNVIAWRIGFLHGGTYFSHHVGFDPDFSDWTPGMVLHIKSIRDLVSLHPAAQRIDLLHGDNPAKRKLGNRAHNEGKFYLFPRDWRGTLRYASLGVFNSASDAVSTLAGQLQIKGGLKRRLKKR